MTCPTSRCVAMSCQSRRFDTRHHLAALVGKPRLYLGIQKGSALIAVELLTISPRASVRIVIWSGGTIRHGRLLAKMAVE